MMSVKAAIGFAFGLLALGSAEAAASGPEAATSSAAVVDLDLAAARTPARLVAPAGQVMLRLRNALPIGPYRVFVTRDQLTGLPVDVVWGSAFSERGWPEECRALVALAAGLYRVSDEPAIAVAVEAVERSAAPCSARAAILEWSLDRTRRETVGLKVEEGREIGFRIERLDGHGQVVKTWSTTLVGKVPDRGWSLRNEQEWLIHEIRLSLARLVAAASDKALPSAIATRAGFKPAPHVWDPEAYLAEFSRGLERAGGRSAAAARPISSQLQTLQDLRASTLEAENERVSLLLTENIRDSEAHEEAAFLLGAFALREAAGQFSDRRLALSRMTVHLAFARALRQQDGPGASGRLAAVLLSTLVGRQREALEALAAMNADAKAPEAVWKRCLQTENDGDWRRLSPSGPLVERIVLFRTLSRAASPQKAAVIFGADSLEPVPDWGRIAFESGAGVEVGNLFLDSLLPLELQEFVSARGAPSGDLAGLLVERWGPIVRGEPGHNTVRVLDGGAWSEFASRHLLAAAASVEVHLENRLGLPDDAKKADEAIEKGLGGADLYPFVRLLRKVPPDCAAIASVVVAVHERVPAATWEYARRRCQNTDPIPMAAIWLAPSFPSGTAFDAENRAQPGARDSIDLAEAERLRSVAPFSRQVVETWLQRRYPPPQRATIAQSIDAFGSLADYRADVLQAIFHAGRDDPKARKPVARKLCELDTDTCIALAWLLAGSGDAEGAAAAYRRAFSGGMDEVSASRHSKWLVDYELGRGHVDEAKEIAERMASTGSGSGFDVLGWFYERTGDLASAERAYRALAERYKDARSMDGFYVRRGIAGDARYEQQAKDAQSRLFPFGLERFDPVKLGGQTFGLLIEELDELLAGAGLVIGDTIVGLDGYRIRDGDQYKAIRQLRTTGDLDLAVWRLATKTLVSVAYPTVGMRSVAAPLRSSWPAAPQFAQFAQSRVPGLEPGTGNWAEQAVKGGPGATAAALQLVTWIANRQAKASTLVPILRGASDDVRLAVLDRAWEIRPEDLVGIAPEIVPLAEHAPPALRVRALGAIGIVAGQYPAGLALLVRTLDDPDAMVRAGAAGAIGGAGSKGQDALPKLRQLARDPDPRVSASAMTSINTIEAFLKAAAPKDAPH